MYQMKPFKHYIYYRNDKLDGINAERQAPDNNNKFALLIPSNICKVSMEQKTYYQIQIIILFDLNYGKVVENTFLLLSDA